MVTVVPTQIEVKKGGYAEFSCFATGVGADDFEYQWFLNKALIAEQNTSILVTDEVSEYNTGEYTCSVKNLYEGIGRSGVAILILGKHKINV